MRRGKDILTKESEMMVLRPAAMVVICEGLGCGDGGLRLGMRFLLGALSWGLRFF